MEYLFERVAYLKGLAEGLNIKEGSKEGKLLLGIIETLEEFAEAIVELDEHQEEMAEYVEALDEDLMDVEEEVFEDEDFDDEDDEEYDDDEIEFAEVNCPYCDEEIYVDEELLAEEDNEIVCPKCHKTIVIVENDHVHNGCCGGGHHHHHEETDQED